MPAGLTELDSCVVLADTLGYSSECFDSLIRSGAFAAS
jgi:hypothetical protein